MVCILWILIDYIAILYYDWRLLYVGKLDLLRLTPIGSFAFPLRRRHLMQVLIQDCWVLICGLDYLRL